MYKITGYLFILFAGFCSNSIAGEDFCRMALEKVYEKDSDIIAVIKIPTTKNSLYSSTVEDSKDCQSFAPSLSVKNPDAIKGSDGLCMILPASEIPPKLCSLRVTLCLNEDNCQSLNIKLETQENHYTAANPAYYEMTFQNE